MSSEENVTVIKPKTGWFEINIKELIRYKDLIFLFVKRNFTAQYKQTILGPLWFLINPIITTVIYTIVFGRVAGLSTDGVPQFAFYLCSTAIWQYFSSCLSGTSNTFVNNAGIFGKVYFPRITMPISTTIFSLINFLVVFISSVFVILFYVFKGENVSLGIGVLLVPILVLQTALLGLGCGIVISSLTTKYRDLQVLVSFGIQLWMYATPVVYSSSQFSGTLKTVMMLNPMSPIVTNFRFAMLNCGTFEGFYWGISWIVTALILSFGVLLFNRVEKTFMDTV